jgi:hypothetical protein
MYPWVLLFGGFSATLLLFVVVVALPLATIVLIGSSKLAEFGTLLKWGSIDVIFGALIMIVLSVVIICETLRISFANQYPRGSSR